MQENQFPDKEKNISSRTLLGVGQEAKIAKQPKMKSKYLNWYAHPLRKWGFNEKAIKTNNKYFLHLSLVTLHYSPDTQDPDPGLTCQSLWSHKVCPVVAP